VVFEKVATRGQGCIDKEFVDDFPAIFPAFVSSYHEYRAAESLSCRPPPPPATNANPTFQEKQRFGCPSE